jgi:hypothetical protein
MTYRVIYTAIQFVLVALVVSFVLHGYDVFSIIFSVAHLVMTTVYLGCIYRDIRHQHDLSSRVLRMSLLFFAVSALGPLMLGPLSALGLSHTVWKSRLVHLYLHFLIDGAFIFGVLAIFLRELIHRSITINEKRGSLGIKILFISIFPSYLLSIVDGSMSTIFYVIAGAGAFLQAIGFAILFRSTKVRVLNTFKRPTRYLLMIAAACLVLKLVLQMIVVLPDTLVEMLGIRQIMVAYLHLVLVGFLTSFLLSRYTESGVNERLTLTATRIFACSFAGIEAGLVLQAIPRSPPFDIQLLILGSSLILWLSFLLFLLSAIRKPAGKLVDVKELVLTNT